MVDVLTKRKIEHDEAVEAVQRLVNSHFNNPRETNEHGRMSIPANPDRDDDLVLSAYIRQRREADEAAAITESGYQQICRKNDDLQALIKKLTDAVNILGDRNERTAEYVDDLERHGTIDHAPAFEIKQRING